MTITEKIIITAILAINTLIVVAMSFWPLFDGKCGVERDRNA